MVKFYRELMPHPVKERLFGENAGVFMPLQHTLVLCLCVLVCPCVFVHVFNHILLTNSGINIDFVRPSGRHSD